MSNIITIYSFADVDRSGKVRWAACELGWEIKEERIALGEHKAEEYLELNPYAMVPTAVIDQETWIDSNAICILLAERDPQERLIPANAPERAIFWQSLGLAVSTLELPVVNYFLASRGFVDQGWKDLVEEGITARMRTYAGNLPENGYLCGSFSIADICAGYVLRIAVQAGILVYEGKLANYLDLLRARPAAIESRVFDSLET